MKLKTLHYIDPCPACPLPTKFKDVKAVEATKIFFCYETIEILDILKVFHDLNNNKMFIFYHTK